MDEAAGRPGRDRQSATPDDTARQAADAPGSTAKGSPRIPSEVVERRATGASDRRLGPPTPRVGLLLVAGAVVAVLLYLGREVLTPFIVGLLVVYLLGPPVDRLARIGVPRWLAVLLVLVIVVLVVVEGLQLLLAPLVGQVRAFIDDLPAFIEAFDAQLRRLGETYRGLQLPPEIRAAIDGALADLAAAVAGLDLGILVPVFTSVFGVVGTIFGYLIIPVWVFFLLKDRPALTAAADRALPQAWRADVWAIVAIVDRTFGQWIRAQLFLGLTVGAATFAGLLLLGAVVDPTFARFALLLAVIAGLFELLPIIGPILAAIPAILLGATVSLEATVAALLLYFVVQQVENNVLVPKIQGDAVELHPSVVMFALVVGGAIAGLLGAILALPVTAAGRSVVRYLFGRLSPEDPAPPATPVDSATVGPRPADSATAGGSSAPESVPRSPPSDADA